MADGEGKGEGLADGEGKGEELDDGEGKGEGLADGEGRGGERRGRGMTRGGRGGGGGGGGGKERMFEVLCQLVHIGWDHITVGRMGTVLKTENMVPPSLPPSLPPSPPR